MSDPVSNADIEDVLSSIRRLVSEEPASGLSRRDDGPSDMADEKVERFVLTPAFRVSEDEAGDTGETAGPEAEPAPQEPEAQGDDAADEGARPDDPASGLQDDEALETAEPTSAGADEAAEETQAIMPAAPQEEQSDADPLPPQVDTVFEPQEDWSDAKLQGAAESGEAPQEEPAAPVSVAEPQEIGELSLEDRIAELEVALSRTPQDWEPDGSEDGSSDESRPLSFDTDPESAKIAEALGAVTAPEEADAGPSAEFRAHLDDADSGEDTDGGASADEQTERGDAWQDNGKADPDSEFFGGDLSLNSFAETLGSVEGHEEPEERDGESAAWAQADAATEEPESVAAESVAFETGRLAPKEPAAVEWRDAEAFAAEEAPKEAQQDDHLAAPEIVDLAVEPEDSAVDAGHSTEVVSDDDAADETPAGQVDPTWEAAAQSREAEGTEENLLANDDAVTLDEEALREMVSDLVREELQGVLGERITRNVRRLVRREIQRALAMRDLE